MSAKAVGAAPLFDGVNQLSIADSERRKRPRTCLRWPVRLFSATAAGAIETVTRDLSSDGFYCRSDVHFAAGDSLLCSLRVPANDGSDRMFSLQCRVRVVRVDEEEPGLFGIGCRIEDYHFVHVERRHLR